LNLKIRRKTAMNKNMKLFSAIFLVFFLSCYAEGADWVRVDLNTNEYSKKHYLDVSKFHQEGDVITFREKYLFPDNSYILSSYSMNCEKNIFKILDIKNYNNKGEAIDLAFPNPGWKAIAPKSERHEIKILVCTDGKPIKPNMITSIKQFRDKMLSSSPR
jgi:hypothetical protein